MATIEELDKKISEKAIENNELSKHKKILEQILFLERREKELMEYIVNVDKWGVAEYTCHDRNFIKYKRSDINNFITEKINTLVIERKKDEVTKEFLLCFSGFICREIERLKKYEEAQYGK